MVKETANKKTAKEKPQVSFVEHLWKNSTVLRGRDLASGSTTTISKVEGMTLQRVDESDVVDARQFFEKGDSIDFIQRIKLLKIVRVYRHCCKNEDTYKCKRAVLDDIYLKVV
ncbi:MAG: hypothetical protein ACI9SQ_000282 [Rubritalea sp.]|jgi:hypothetical protein